MKFHLKEERPSQASVINNNATDKLQILLFIQLLLECFAKMCF